MAARTFRPWFWRCADRCAHRRLVFMAGSCVERRGRRLPGHHLRSGAAAASRAPTFCAGACRGCGVGFGVGARAMRTKARFRPKVAQAYTLTEMLVVLVIIGLLAAIV